MALITYTVQSLIDTRLPATPEMDPAVDPATFAQISMIYNAIRQLQIGITDYAGVGQKEQSTWAQLNPLDTIRIQNMDRLYVKAGEAIPLGALVNYYDAGGGVLQVRLANASSGTPRPAHGYCSTIGGIANGSYGETIAGIGLCSFITGMAIGTTYYLSTTPGLITNAKPAGPNLQQPVGFAIGGSLLFFNCGALP